MQIEIQGSYLTKQLKDCLHKKKYKLVISKTEKFITKQELEVGSMCASILIKLLFLQCKAVIKILQKNIIRKYTYEQSIIASLLRILNRNNERCYYILLNKIKDNEIIIKESDYEQKKYNYYQVNSFKIDVNSLELRKHCQQFQQVYYESTLYCLAYVKLYNLQYNQKNIQYVEIMSSVSANTIKCMILKLQLQILLCRIYIEEGKFEKADKKLSFIIQEILIVFDRILKRYENHQNTKQTNKFKYYYKKTFKLTMIVSVMIVRSKMLLNQQKLASNAIKILYYSFQQCATQISHFQKYLKPEVYLYGQYCRYQSQKFEVGQLIQNLFKNNVQKPSNFYPIRQNKNTIMEFYNKKMGQFHLNMQKNKTQNKLKRIKNNKLSPTNGKTQHFASQLQNSGIRKTRQTKSKNISLGLSSLSGFQKTKKRNSLMSQSDFYRPIFKQINQTNTALLTTRKKQGKFFNPMNQMSLLLSQNIQRKSSNKQKNLHIVNNKKIAKTIANTQKALQEQQILSKLQQEQYYFNKQLKYRKQKLKQKGSTKLYKSIIPNDVIEEQEDIFKFKTNTSDNKYIQQPKIDSIKQIQRQVKKTSAFASGSKIRQKIKHMIGKKSKIQQFMQLLIQNKQYLGIKRLGQKTQYLKKKQELKQKFRSTRKTTSIHNQRNQMSSFSFLAQDIIKFSLQDWDQKDESNRKQQKQQIQKTLCSTNQNNFKIGQKSIQILMNKLQKQKQDFMLRSSSKTKTLNILKNEAKSHRLLSVQTKKLKKKANQWKCKFVL